MSYYSELLIKIKDKSKIVTTADQLQNTIDNSFPGCKCKILQGSGTYSLLKDVLNKIMEQLLIFNFILSVLIIIRIIQSLFWISNEYTYELNELKILGSSKSQIIFLFIVISFLIGNLGFLLGLFGTILIPSMISYLIAFISVQNVTILPPTVIQILLTFLLYNFVITVIAFVPSYQIASKKIIKQKTRE